MVEETTPIQEDFFPEFRCQEAASKKSQARVSAGERCWLPTWSGLSAHPKGKRQPCAAGCPAEDSKGVGCTNRDPPLRNTDFQSDCTKVSIRITPTMLGDYRQLVVMLQSLKVVLKVAEYLSEEEIREDLWEQASNLCPASPYCTDADGFRSAVGAHPAPLSCQNHLWARQH